MFVVRPVEIDDSTLTSSTIPEPDTGEVLWDGDRSNEIASDYRATSVCVLDDVLYTCDLTNDTIRQYDLDGNYLGGFSVSAQASSPQSIATDGTYIYVFDAVSDTNITVYTYDSDGVYQSESVGISLSEGGFRFITGTYYNGYFYIASEDLGVGDFRRVNQFRPSDGLLFQEYEVADLIYDGSNRTINALTPVSDGFYIGDDQGRFFATDTNFTTSSKIDELSWGAPGGMHYYSGDNRIYIPTFSGPPSTIRTYFEGLLDGGWYNVGEQVIKTETNKIYEASTINNDDPETGVGLVPPSWVEISATNKYKMFDESDATQSEQLVGTELVVDIEPGEIANTIAGFNIDGVSNVNVTMTDPTAGEVYNQDVNLNYNEEVTDWYYYYFSDIEKGTEFILTDLPAYKDATITVTFTGEEGEVKVGILSTGKQLELGTAKYGTTLESNDYSRREVDDFGNVTTIRRGISKVVNYDVFTPTSRVGYVYRTLADLRTINCIWYSTGNIDDPTLAYGYYTDFLETISAPTVSDFTLTVETIV